MQVQSDEKPPMLEQPDVPRSCFIVHVGSLTLGVPVGDTQTIFRIGEITPVPLGPRHVAGLTNLRGRVMTVVSLRSKLEKTTAEVARGALAIGLQADGEEYALVVDQVSEVIDIDASQRLPVPAHLDPEHARLMEGLYKVGDTLLPVLIPQELFASSTGVGATTGGPR